MTITTTKKYDNRCTIIISGADARIDGLVPSQPIIDVTSYLTPGYRFMPRFKRGFWDGRTKLYRQQTRTFPTGLLEDVREALEDSGIKVLIEDKRSMPALPVLDDSWGEKLKLEGVSFDYPYDFQPNVAKIMMEKQRGVVAIATNGGKTEIACLVTAALRQPTLFMVPGKELLYQTAERFRTRLRLDTGACGTIGDGSWSPGSWVTVATVQTLFQGLAKPRVQDFLKRTQMVFADECHHVGSDSWYQVLRACPAYFRYGLSGTPLKRTDGADLRLVGATGPVIAEIRNKDLIERGISNPVEIQFLKITEPEIPRGVEYADAYKIGIVENPYRNKAFCKLAEQFVAEGRMIMILVREIDHGLRLDKGLWTYCKFTPHQFISGKESSDIRRKALSDFRKGDLPIIIATSILDEGVDIPNIDVLMLAGSGKSSIKTLQRVGRGLRRGGTAGKLIVVDTADFQNNYLLKHSLQRMEDYKGEGCFEITVLEE